MKLDFYAEIGLGDVSAAIATLLRSALLFPTSLREAASVVAWPENEVHVMEKRVGNDTVVVAVVGYSGGGGIIVIGAGVKSGDVHRDIRYLRYTLVLAGSEPVVKRIENLLRNNGFREVVEE